MEERGEAGHVLFIDASERYEAGKNQNILPDETITDIIELYNKFRAGKLDKGVVEDKFAYVATFTEIAENEFNLNIPRYVDTFEEEEPVDMEATKARIAKLEAELEEVQGKMNDYLKELNL